MQFNSTKNTAGSAGRALANRPSPLRWPIQQVSNSVKMTVHKFLSSLIVERERERGLFHSDGVFTTKCKDKSSLVQKYWCLAITKTLVPVLTSKKNILKKLVSFLLEENSLYFELQGTWYGTSLQVNVSLQVLYISLQVWYGMVWYLVMLILFFKLIPQSQILIAQRSVIDTFP